MCQEMILSLHMSAMQGNVRVCVRIYWKRDLETNYLISLILLLSKYDTVHLKQTPYQ